MKNTILVIVGLGLIVLLMFWFNEKDKKLMEMSERYEACVWEQIQMSPSYYYEVNGEYPTCK